MITFIKSNDVNSIKTKIKLIYILNVMDILFTLMLLKTGLFEEANVIMTSVVESPILSVLIKVILVYILLKILIIRIEKANIFQLRVSNIILLAAVSVYIMINLSHIMYILYFLKIIL